MFSRDDARWLSEAVGAVYQAQTEAEIVATVFYAVHRRFNLLGSSFEEIGLGVSSYVAHGLRHQNSIPADHAAFMHDQPLAWVVGDPSAPRLLHMRERVPFAEWAKTDHYNGIARPMGWNDQLLITVANARSYVVLGLQRSEMFSESERELARLFQPHVEAGWERVRKARRPLGCSHPIRIDLSHGLEPRTLSATQTTLLRSYFPEWRHSLKLPDELRDWTRRSLAQLRAVPPAPLGTFAAISARGRLLVRCFTHSDDREVGATLVFVEHLAVPSYLCLTAANLTPRECEVLHWIAEGKRDAEIAVILSVARRTIEKHVENLLRKLGVENRAAAVNAAQALLTARPTIPQL